MTPRNASEAVKLANDPARAPVATPAHKPRRNRGLTIRLKLTLWYGSLFLLAGVLLIAINYFLVRDSLAVAPEKARAVVAERYGLDPEDLEPHWGFRPPMPFFGPQLEVGQQVEINGVPVTRLIEERTRQGQATLVATHQPTLTPDLFDRAVVIDQGRLLYDGNLPDLLETAPDNGDPVTTRLAIAMARLITGGGQ